MQVSFTEKDKDRFWSKVRKHDRCWIWIGSKGSRGYGQFSIQHKTYSAHRISFCIENGFIPVGMCVLHECDIKECVRPSHLFIGTNSDNMADRDMKGRQSVGEKQQIAVRSNHWRRKFPKPTNTKSLAYGKRNGHYTKPECTPRGIDAGNAKLTDEKVRMLRLEYSSNRISQEKLAEKYGICQSVASAIINRATWRHVI